MTIQIRLRIRIFTGRILDSRGCKAPSCGADIEDSDAQADLSLCCEHMSKGKFSLSADHYVYTLISYVYFKAIALSH